jgi:hypothetical protein
VKRLSWTFWVCVPIGVGLIAVAAWVVITGELMRRNFKHERVTPLAGFDCDLSKPGEWELPVTVTYPYGHGLKVIVEGPAVTSKQPWEPEPWLEGLEGTIGPAEGPCAADGPKRLMEFLSFNSGADSRAIVRTYCSDPGKTVLRLSVTRGAEKLAGVPHRVVVYNDVCGCELLGVFWGDVLSAGVGVGGLVVGGIGVGLRTKSRRGPLREASPNASVGRC